MVKSYNEDTKEITKKLLNNNVTLGNLIMDKENQNIHGNINYLSDDFLINNYEE